jgi:hypothetical protein
VADGVVGVGDHHIPQPPAGLGAQRLQLAEVVEPADQAAVDVGPVVVQHLLLPPAHVGGADPDGPVDAGVQQALGPPVDEGVLAGPGAKALPEQHHPGPPVGGPLAEGVVDGVDQHPVVGAPLGHPVQRQRRRPQRVLHGHRGHVAPGQVLGRLDGHIVHVPGAGGGDHQQQLPVEGPAAPQLLDGQGDPLGLGGGALQPHEHPDGLGRGRLAHDRLDRLGAEHGGHVAPALAAEGLPGHPAPRTAGGQPGRRRIVEGGLDLLGPPLDPVVDPADQPVQRAAEDRQGGQVAEGPVEALVAGQAPLHQAAHAGREQALAGGQPGEPGGHAQAHGERLGRRRRGALVDRQPREPGLPAAAPEVVDRGQGGPGERRHRDREVLGVAAPAGQLLEHADGGAGQAGGRQPPAGGAHAPARQPLARPWPRGALDGQPGAMAARSRPMLARRQVWRSTLAGSVRPAPRRAMASIESWTRAANE